MSRQAFLSLGTALLFALQPAVSAQETQRPADPPSAAAKQQLYTCPMHPEIQWSRPDNCPICDMQLIAKRTKAPSPAGDMERDDHIGMSMDGHATRHDHHAMGSMMSGCSMCMEMMGMGGTGSMSGMQSHRASAPAQGYRATRPVYRSYSGAYSRGSTGGPSRGCGC